MFKRFLLFLIAVFFVFSYFLLVSNKHEKIFAVDPEIDLWSIYVADPSKVTTNVNPAQAPNVIDGNDATAWFCPTNGDWWIMDLGSTYQISKTGVFMTGGHVYFYYSENGSSWTLVTSISGSYTENNFSPSINARYFRFLAQDSYAMDTVKTLRLWGVGSSPTPTPPTPTPPTPTPPTPTPPTPSPPTPTPPTPTPSGSSTPTPSGSYTPTPTSSLSYSPTPSSSYSHSPTPTFTNDVITPVIIYIIDNINKKTYEVSRQRQDEPVLLCDQQPTFIGVNAPEDFLDIFNNGDPSSKAARAEVANGETMWSSSPENPLNLGNYSAYAGPLGPTNTVWFNIVECVDGTPIPTPTTSPPPSSPPPWEEFLEINQLNLPLDIIALLLLLFGSVAVLWPSILNFIVNTAPIVEFLSSAPIKTRGRACGIVYEGQTKKPIKKAILRLFSAEDNKLRKTVLTNDKGEFSLLVPSGRYYLEVAATQYDFPSFYMMRRLKPSLYALKKSGQTDSGQFSSGLKDGILKNIYFGEILEVKGGIDASQSYALNLNIPLDKSTTLNLEEKAVKILKIIEAILMKIKWPCLIFGLIVALVAIYLKINILNMIILGLYFIIIFYEVYRLLVKSRPYGLVMDEGKKAIGLALIRFNDKNNQVKSTAISGADGKFTAQVNPGKYNLSAKKTGFFETEQRDIAIKSARRLEKLNITLKKI